MRIDWKGHETTLWGDGMFYFVIEVMYIQTYTLIQAHGVVHLGYAHSRLRGLPTVGGGGRLGKKDPTFLDSVVFLSVATDDNLEAMERRGHRCQISCRESHSE